MLEVQADEARRQDRTLRSWRSITEVGGGLMLAVDFGSTQRAESGFQDLAARLDPTRTVWETLQPPLSAAGGGTGEDYLAWWLGGLSDTTRAIDAIFGYCIGAVFAAEVHSQVAAHQDEPPLLLLFDPELPTRPSLLRDFDNAIAQLSVMLPSGEPGKLCDAARSAMDSCADFGEFGVGLMKIFAAGVAAAFDGIPVSPAFTAGLTGSFNSFIHYAIAAYRDAVPGSWASAAVIMSRDGQDSDDLPGGQFRFDIGQPDLLRHEEVARTASRILTHDR